VTIKYDFNAYMTLKDASASIAKIEEAEKELKKINPGTELSVEVAINKAIAPSSYDLTESKEQPELIWAEVITRENGVIKKQKFAATPEGLLRLNKLIDEITE